MAAVFDFLKGSNCMILSFSHKGLERFFNRGDLTGIQPAHQGKLSLILDRLHTAMNPLDMRLPGWRLHCYKGTGKNKPDIWSVDVDGNTRVLFSFDGVNAVKVDYGDPH